MHKKYIIIIIFFHKDITIEGMLGVKYITIPYLLGGHLDALFLVNITKGFKLFLPYLEIQILAFLLDIFEFSYSHRPFPKLIFLTK
jgi:hypothetical protein